MIGIVRGARMKSHARPNYLSPPGLNSAAAMRVAMTTSRSVLSMRCVRNLPSPSWCTTPSRGAASHARSGSSSPPSGFRRAGPTRARRGRAHHGPIITCKFDTLSTADTTSHTLHMHMHVHVHCTCTCTCTCTRIHRSVHSPVSNSSCFAQVMTGVVFPAGGNKKVPSEADPAGGEAEELDDVSTYEDIGCTVCGSVDDADSPILLCDAHGCDSACHMACLRTVLARVPEGDWQCEACEEAAAPGVAGGAPAAHCLLSDTAARWKLRVSSVHCSAQLALCVGSLERSLRLHDLALARTQFRKGQRASFVRRGAMTMFEVQVIGRQIDVSTGHVDFLLESTVTAGPATCRVTLPKGAHQGKSIRCRWAGGIFKFKCPARAASCGTFDVTVSHSFSSANTFMRQSLSELATPELMCRVLQFELKHSSLAQQAADDQTQVCGVLKSLVMVLERGERRQRTKFYGQQSCTPHGHTPVEPASRRREGAGFQRGAGALLYQRYGRVASSRRGNIPTASAAQSPEPGLLCSQSRTLGSSPAMLINLTGDAYTRSSKPSGAGPGPIALATPVASACGSFGIQYPAGNGLGARHPSISNHAEPTPGAVSLLHSHSNSLPDGTTWSVATPVGQQRASPNGHAQIISAATGTATGCATTTGVWADTAQMMAMYQEVLAN